MHDPQEFLRSLLRTSEDEILPAGTDLTSYYQPWGFTIYGSFCGPDSDQHC
ncbi:hypothetical protein CC80DRAFT_411979 [Byssothecium circinans]|uniref:Uncharacterized protein n=1 Tax=Byssothecium circinans TaxID=147558 RepID=A0A6A5TZC6_9PLEO|nr:hypothetical protein CC80DRAFT_411979 [Byssothecium circinans]